MPINWNMLDTQQPQKLAALFDPNMIAMRNAEMERNNLSSLSSEAQLMGQIDQMRQAPIVREQQAQERAYQMKERGWKESDRATTEQERLRKMQMFEQLKSASTPEQQKQIFAQLFPEKAAELAFKPPTARDYNQPFLPDGSPNVAYQQYKLAEQRAGRAQTADNVNWQTETTADGSMVQVHPRTGAIRPLGIKSAQGAPRKAMTADQEAKYRQKFGDAYGSTIAALQSSQEVVNTAKALRESKGLEGITGLSGYIPNLPGTAPAKAQQEFETLQGKITKMAKDAAASSGALGPMAVQEWKILRDQVAAIDPTKLDAAQMQEVLDYLVIQSENAARITEESYMSTFGPDFDQYPQFADPRSKMSQANRNTSDVRAKADAILKGK